MSRQSDDKYMYILFFLFLVGVYCGLRFGFAYDSDDDHLRTLVRSKLGSSGVVFLVFFVPLVLGVLFFTISRIIPSTFESNNFVLSILKKAAVTVCAGAIGSAVLSGLGIEGTALAVGASASVVVSLIGISVN